MRKQRLEIDDAEIEDMVVEKGINRTAKVVKGGRRFSFTALVVAGNRHGVVGYGYGKARDVPMAVEKATKEARQSLMRVRLVGDTISHEVLGRFGASRILLKPASPGTGVVAGGVVRGVMNMVGVRDVLTKSYGSNNPINLLKATFNGLSSLMNKETVQKLRGVSLT